MRWVDNEGASSAGDQNTQVEKDQGVKFTLSTFVLWTRKEEEMIEECHEMNIFVHS